METLFIGKNAVFLSETDSTNSYAIDLLKKVNPAEGTIVHTPSQTRGKGQRGSSWRSEPASNLAVSVILKPGFLDVGRQFFLYQVAALAVHDTIAQLLNNSHFDIKIKWPNDILVNRRKVAGVLIENNLQNNRVNWCVVGVGININQEDFEGLPKASSLKLLSGEPLKIDLSLDYLCVYLEKHYLALMSNKFEVIRKAYLERLFGLNEWMDFSMNGSLKKMLVTGISASGLLLLEDESGSAVELDVKGAEWLY